MHSHESLSETVEVEAGIIADIETGQLRSRAMDHHYALRKESLHRRQVKARRMKITRWFLLTALGVALALAMSSESARDLARQVWAGLEIEADA